MKKGGGKGKTLRSFLTSNADTVHYWLLVHPEKDFFSIVFIIFSLCYAGRATLLNPQVPS